MRTKFIANEIFLHDIAHHGLTLAGRGADPGVLGYQNRWSVHIPRSGDMIQRQQAILAALSLFGEDVPVWVWRRGGVWNLKLPVTRPPTLDFRSIVHQFFALSGVHDGDTGALCYERDERNLLLGLVLLNSTVAWNLAWDLVIIPEQRGFVFHLDYAGAMVMECRDQAVYNNVGRRFFAKLEGLGVSMEPDARHESVPVMDSASSTRTQ